MAEASWQLISVAEFRDHAELGALPATRIERVVKLASRVVEGQGLRGRRVVRPDADLVEYYSPGLCESEVYMRSWPPGITELAELQSGTYTALTVNEDYAVTAEALLTRISSGTPTYWTQLWRGIRLTHRNGYADTTVVPDIIKDVALRLAARLWKETERKLWGLSSYNDDAGNFTRIAQTMLTRADRQQLEEAGEALPGMDSGWEEAAA